MTTVAVSTSEMTAPSTFSYAQAAKGQGAPSPSTQAQDAPAPAANKLDAPDADATEPADVAEAIDSHASVVEKQDSESLPGSEIDARSESTQGRRSDSRRDGDAGRLDRPWRRNDKTRSSSTTTRSADEQDARKARRSKKGKTSEKPSEEQPAADKDQEAAPEPPKVELSEAPIPSVNIWQQRKEAAQVAKGKSPADETATDNPSSPQDGNKVPTKPIEGSTTASAVTNGVKPQRKAIDATRPERAGPRGTRLADKDGKGEVPPSVDDSASWPTPETAVTSTKDDKKKPVVEKSDRSDKDVQEDGSQKPRQKEKWVTYDYVPTVSFETQLPQMRNSKPRGGARGARESNSTRASSNSGTQDKAASATSLNKTNESKPRDGNSANATNAGPAAAAKRGSLDAASDQKKAAGQTGAGKGKDSSAQANENAQPARERPEGRNERGRGGFRGRGAHVNSQAQAAGAAGFSGQGSGARTQGHYSPPLRQNAHGQMFMPPAQRGRGGRNGAGNYHRMSLPNGTSRMPAQFAPYDYALPPMTGMAYQPHPYWDNMVLAMLRAQIEYYFSIENLCKDMYLRARMDDQGFVPLHFISAFKRIRDLSRDMNMIRAVCEDSHDVEFVMGSDDTERLRRREQWQKFVLPRSERDEFARHAGPEQFTVKNRTYPYHPQFNGVPPAPYGVPSPTHYAANPNDAAFHPFAEGAQMPHGMNGAVNGVAPSQLSADVPDFSPSGAMLTNGVGASDAGVVSGMQNGHVNGPAVNGVHAEENTV